MINYTNVLSTAILLCSFTNLSCNEHKETLENKTTESNYNSSPSPSKNNSSNYVEREEDNERTSSVNEEESNGCKYEDGTHSATVNYYNPETGFSNTYTLDVEVEDCQVIQINFPNGGWLDSDHINPEELDDSGNCTIEGDEGRTYEIQIDD